MKGLFSPLGICNILVRWRHCSLFSRVVLLSQGDEGDIWDQEGGDKGRRQSIA